MNKKPKSVPFRRKREGMTDYKKRMKTLISGKPRLICRKSLHNIVCQIAVFTETGDKIICSAHSRELIKKGWSGSRKSLPAAYLTGLLLASKAKKAKVTEAIFDIGLFRAVHGSKLYAALAGAVDGGMNIPHEKDCLPKTDRISGAHIAAYGEELKKKGADLNKRQFNKTDAAKVKSQFETIKAKLIKGE